MTETVGMVSREIMARIEKAEAQMGQRDLMAEKEEEMRRRQAATKKARAVVKFENVMSQMFFRNLAQATINVF